ncbi:hypothetical protein [Halobacillus sp. K22]|uniref:hypothetical protein n=1 Tax=Halobacillus sp. K22 TaxID=3457431 RepID=UPI003FCE9FCE
MNADLCELLANDGFLCCYLTDAAGSPVDKISCGEQGNREDISVQLPDGEHTLQKVTIRNQGYVFVTLTTSTTVQGQMISDSVEVLVECDSPCP